MALHARRIASCQNDLPAIVLGFNVPSMAACLLCKENTVKSLDEQQAYWQCSDCGYLFLEPSLRKNLSEEKARYTEHNNDLGDKNYIQYLEKTWSKVNDLVSSGSLVLDYGCGPTKGLEKVLEGSSLRVISYDPIFWPEELDEHRKQIDVIYCSEVIEHMFDPNSELDKWEELLKPGGLITLRTSFHPGPEKFKSWWYKDDPTHIGFFNEKTFEWFAEKRRWEILHMHSPYVSFRVEQGQ
jgi:SAM-dependent methyltransferase